ncbi:hypothetical protein ETD86_43095 [Nonomuraea turkmeniaca]|uniref:Haem-binding uptake Tiki superfamily ChaN domain-containing protein n=1 Tax=Nonomuraea turkmeniaca TaxID=103838 RepID=A0A5S4F0I4_9ACTN|nr:hypothetical protein [Nonomuraea turkmeniaca]TMR09541.1 hypothetical protein ETD86_43095 [Nonomuraea turkmeniaca]
MPSVDTPDSLLRAVAEFDTDDYELAVEPAALDRAERSLDESGLLLLGELHGVRENPLIILALMRLLGLTNLALEWPRELAPQLDLYLADGTGLNHPWWWFGEGTVTAGHLAVLKKIDGVRVTLFDEVMRAGDWSERDASMARRVLAANVEPALVVTGNAHTLTSPTDLGMSMGACLAAERPSLESVRIDYGTGSFYNLEPRHVQAPCAALGVPEFGEATVPHLPLELLWERLER